MRFVTFFILLLLAGSLHRESGLVTQSRQLADDPEVTFGAEFELKHLRHYLDGIYYRLNEMVFMERDDRTYRLVVNKLLKKHEKLCANGRCRIEILNDNPNYRVVYPDGFYFAVKWDANTVEVTTKPSTSNELLSQRARVQSDLFDTAASVGLHPPPIGSVLGAGHVSIGLDSFRGDARRLLDFIVDFTNHSELSNGILNRDFDNAAPLSADPLLLARLAKLKALVDSGDITTVEELLVLFWNEEIQDGNWKRMALSITKGRVEIRSVRAQQSMDHFVKLVRLFEARMKYLEKHPRPKLSLLPPIDDPAQAAENFHRYVTESGLDWKEYVELIPRAYRDFDFDDAGNATARPVGFLRRCAVNLATFGRTRFETGKAWRLNQKPETTQTTRPSNRERLTESWKNAKEKAQKYLDDHPWR